MDNVESMRLQDRYLRLVNTMPEVMADIVIAMDNNNNDQLLSVYHRAENALSEWIEVKKRLGLRRIFRKGRERYKVICVNDQRGEP